MSGRQRSFAGAAMFVLLALARLLSIASLWMIGGGCRGNDRPHDCSYVPKACDITKVSCQEAVLRITACEHGNPNAEVPKMRVISQAQFREELEAEAADMTVDRPWDAALTALHLSPADASVLETDIAVTASSTAAFYDPHHRRVSIIRSALSNDARNNVFTLSHELTHYLQDLDFDLLAYDDKYIHTTDESVATHSLIEGDAVVTSVRVLARISGSRPEAVDWLSLEGALMDSLSEAIGMTDALLTTIAFELPYAVGTPYVANTWAAGRRADVDELFADPPRAVIDMTGGMRRPTSIQSLDCGLPDAPDGFSLAAIDSLGYTGAKAILEAAAPHGSLYAPSFDGDVIGAYAANDESGAQGVVAWRMRFAVDDYLQTFMRQIAGFGFETHNSGRELLITTSTDPTQNPLKGELLKACPPPSMPGKASDMMQNAALRRLHPRRR